MEASASLERRAARVRVLLMDCDGVLTDGRVWLFPDNEQQKGFHVRDGLGLDLWHRAGHQSGVISGLDSTALERRAAALKISFVSQGNANKLSAFEEIVSSAGVETDAVAYMGDDLNDLPLMRRSGFAIAVADAVPEVRAAAHYVTHLNGGQGAAREVIELILKAQGRWSELVDAYLK